MRTLRTYTVVPRLPPPLERLREIAENLWWAWAPEARELFWRIDRALWEQVHGNPIELLSTRRAEAPRRARDRRRVPRPASTSAHADAPALPDARGLVPQASSPSAHGARIAYFSMEYGLHECLPDLLGRPRRARRRSPQDRERSRPAARRRRPRVRRGLLPPGAQRGRLAAGALPDQRLAPHARCCRSRTRRASASSSTCTYPDRIVYAQLWTRAGRARAALPARREHRRRTRAEDRSITGPALRRRLGVPRAPGDHARHRRRPRARGAGHLADGLPHERGPLGVPRASSASAALVRERGASVRGGARGVPAQNVFTTHTPVPAGNDVFAPELVTQVPRAVPRRARHHRGAAARPRAAWTRRQDAQFSMPVLAIRAVGSLQRRLARCTATSRATCGASSGPICPSTRSRSSR